MRKIKYIFIHCSAGHGDLSAVKRWWHSSKPNGMGWKTGGYHKWVDYDGEITDLYPLSTVTNGVFGFNGDSVHVCYRGGVKKDNVYIAEDTRTEEQKAGILNAIYQFLEELKQHQDISDIIIQGHRDISPDKNLNGLVDPIERIKECPSFDAIPEYSWITA